MVLFLTINCCVTQMVESDNSILCLSLASRLSSQIPPPNQIPLSMCGTNASNARDQSAFRTQKLKVEAEKKNSSYFPSPRIPQISPLIGEVFPVASEEFFNFSIFQIGIIRSD